MGSLLPVQLLQCLGQMLELWSSSMGSLWGVPMLPCLGQMLGLGQVWPVLALWALAGIQQDWSWRFWQLVCWAAVLQFPCC